MIFRNFLPAIVFVLFASACTTTPVKFVPVEPAGTGLSIIYVYRVQSVSNMMISPVLQVDGIEQFPVKNGRYSYLELTPGMHEFQLKSGGNYPGRKKIALETRADRRYFLKIDSSLQFKKNQPYSRSFSITDVVEPVALAEIAECDFMEARMPSKYLWSKGQKKVPVTTEQENSDANFEIEKTRNPFSR